MLGCLSPFAASRQIGERNTQVVLGRQAAEGDLGLRCVLSCAVRLSDREPGAMRPGTTTGGRGTFRMWARA